jgi:pimeloyl-ACP methyl ester carboxylesterase
MPVAPIPNFVLALPTVPVEPEALDAWVSQREIRELNLKPDNEARIVWNDPANPTKLALSIVYLHGFTASPGESSAQPARIAEVFGANLYLARLPGHGLDLDDALRGMTPAQWLNAATEALAIGLALGDHVIFVGTSLGASLEIFLAAHFPDCVFAVVAWSPGVRAHDPITLDSMCVGAEVLRDLRPRSEAQLRYWSAAVHPDGYRSLRAVFNDLMTPALFARVQTPFFLAYYYRDPENQDQTASVPAMLSMFDSLGTPAAIKRKRAFANGTHVIGSPWRSEAAEDVFRETCAFLTDVAGLAVSKAALV